MLAGLGSSGSRSCLRRETGSTWRTRPSSLFRHKITVQICLSRQETRQLLQHVRSVAQLSQQSTNMFLITPEDQNSRVEVRSIEDQKLSTGLEAFFRQLGSDLHAFRNMRQCFEFVCSVIATQL